MSALASVGPRYSPAFLLGRRQHVDEVARRGIQHAHELHHRGLQHEEQFRVESGLPGRLASSVTSAAWIALPWTTAALMLSAGAVLMNVVSTFASTTGSPPV